MIISTKWPQNHIFIIFIYNHNEMIGHFIIFMELLRFLGYFLDLSSRVWTILAFCNCQGKKNNKRTNKIFRKLLHKRSSLLWTKKSHDLQNWSITHSHVIHRRFMDFSFFRTQRYKDRTRDNILISPVFRSW